MKTYVLCCGTTDGERRAWRERREREQGSVRRERERDREREREQRLRRKTEERESFTKERPEMGEEEEPKL